MSKLKFNLPRIKINDARVLKPQAKKADPELLTSAHRRWADEVKRRAGYRCQAIEQGDRCRTMAPARLYADHINERRDGGSRLDVQNGQCLCARHHAAKTIAARVDRLSR